MYPKLILRNVFRNLQTYTIYFFSLTLIYSLLYAFNALPSHPVMQSLSGAKEMLTTVMSQYMGLLSYLILEGLEDWDGLKSLPLIQENILFALLILHEESPSNP